MSLADVYLESLTKPGWDNPPYGRWHNPDGFYTDDYKDLHLQFWKRPFFNNVEFDVHHRFPDPFTFEDWGLFWRTEAVCRSDGGSIPPIIQAWPVGWDLSKDGPWRIVFYQHDYTCRRRRIASCWPRRHWIWVSSTIDGEYLPIEVKRSVQCHRMLYRAGRSIGRPAGESWAVYNAVIFGGPRW